VGPWTTIYDAELDDAPPAGVSDRDPLVVYHPVLPPWRESDGDVIVVVFRSGLDPEHRGSLAIAGAGAAMVKPTRRSPNRGALDSTRRRSATSVVCGSAGEVE